MKKIFLFLFVPFLVTCSSTRKFNGQQGADPLAYQKDTLDITCDVERLPDKKFTMARHPQDYQWIFAPLCPKQGDTSAQQVVSKPLNIIFVVDITQSMLASFDVLTKKIFDLNQSLKAAKRTAKIAGIGFSNYFRNYSVTNFLSGDDFANQIQTWQLVDVGASSAAGQLAISVAIDKFVALQHQSPEMNDAQNIILYASDDAIFSPDSQDDYSVDTLAAKVANAKIGNLEFLYSVPTTIADADKVDGAPDPLTQIKEFVTKSKVSARALSFPLTAEILNTFTTQMVDVIKPPDEMCAVDILSFQAGIKESVPTIDTRENVFADVQKKTVFSFKLSPDPNTLNYWLEINRCCKKVQSDKTCESTDQTRLNYTFKAPEPQT